MLGPRTQHEKTSQISGRSADRIMSQLLQ
jgi:hypothetical protein